jgi:hypothetical protein
VQAQIDGELAAVMGEMAEDSVGDHEIARLLVNDMTAHFEGPWVTLRVDFDAEGHARFVAPGFGSGLRVLAPPELKQWVQSEAAAMAAL